MKIQKISWLGVLCISSFAFAAPGDRIPTRENLGLVLDGAPAGYLKAYEGGGPRAEVVEVPPGPSETYPKKQIGRVAYDDLFMSFGLSSASPMLQWIENTLNFKYSRKSGAILGCDYNFNAVSQLQFERTSLTEIIFPAMDATSGKSAGIFSVKLSPEFTRRSSASGKCAPVANEPQKNWMTQNFKLELPGLDTTKVSKIESFTVKQIFLDGTPGEDRRPGREPGRLQFSNLKITLSESSAESWYKWLDEFVVQGRSDDSNEKTGAIIMLSQNLAQELGRINLYNVGILNIHRAVDSTADSIRKVTVELYVEHVSLNVK